MTVDDLIKNLLKISDKSQEVKFYSAEFPDGQDLQSFNSVEEVRYEGTDIAILEWK